MFSTKLTFALAGLGLAAALQAAAALWSIGVADRQVLRGRVASDIHVAFVELSVTKQRLRSWVAQRQADAGADAAQRDALLDEAEVLPGLKIWAQERSMYQSLVALADVAEATKSWATLQPVLRQRLEFFCQPVLPPDTCLDGYGWDGPPGLGPRGCYVYSSQSVSEKPPGENYITRGFISCT